MQNLQLIYLAIKDWHQEQDKGVLFSPPVFNTELELQAKATKQDK